MTIGERIKKRRKELNLTQQELAYKLGYKDRSAVCQVERDKNNSITTDRIEAFALALDCTPADLMGWTNTFVLDGDEKVIIEVCRNNEHAKEILMAYANTVKKGENDNA